MHHYKSHSSALLPSYTVLDKHIDDTLKPGQMPWTVMEVRLDSEYDVKWLIGGIAYS